MNSPEIALSFRTIVIAQCKATVLAGVGWTVGVLIGGFGLAVLQAGLAVSGVLFAVSILALMFFSPSKLRPIATVATLWSVTSFVRFIVALGVSSVLYYVANFGRLPFLVSFLLTAVFLLITETKALSKMLAEYSHTTTD